MRLSLALSVMWNSLPAEVTMMLSVSLTKEVASKGLKYTSAAAGEGGAAHAQRQAAIPAAIALARINDSL